MSDAVRRLNDTLRGRYRIERELGEGGMATVYLADDIRHERKVALKVLKPELAAVVGAERFLAEIKTTANLQHPHILPLFDSGEADGFLFYVMPYVQGETLRERIDREKQLPIDEAVRIAAAVGNALHYAHEHGVVHRDIKPGNILMQAGQPVVGDFGIALAVGSAGGARLTETGLSVGTPYYMSPEQATGDQLVGPSSDIYALGAVLYELLTGDPPYMGSTAQAVLGQIISGDPVSAVKKRRSIPPNIDAAIRRSLEKLPADRFVTAADFTRALSDPAFRHGDAAAAHAATSPGHWRTATALTSALALLFAGLAFRASSRPEPVRHVERFAMPFLEGQDGEPGRGEAFALSPDGTMLVYRQGPLANSVLAARRWDELSATIVRETGNARHPTVSPNGLEVAFAHEGEIKALAFAGGPIRTLAEGAVPLWGPDGFIYVGSISGTRRIPAAGGAVEVLTEVADGEIAHGVTDILPGGEHALMFVIMESDETEIRALDLSSGEMTPITFGGPASYLPSGHLVFGTDCNWIGSAWACPTMMAAAFDPDRVEMLGAPAAIMDGLIAWSFADDGKLFYSQGTTAGGSGPKLQLTWVTREGRATPVDPGWTFWQGPDVNQGWSISPDGSRVALREFTEEGYDIWVKRLDTGPRSRLTYGEAHERMPQWSSDGEDVVFLSDRGGGLDVWTRRADGTGAPVQLVDPEPMIATVEWDPAGEWLLLRTSTGNQTASERDVLAFRPSVDSVPTPLLATEYREIDPVVSPDGRWLAYASDETGRYEIYVRPFPDASAGRWQVSIEGGRNPQWSSDGSELFLIGPEDQMMVAGVSTDDGFSAAPPEVLFEADPGWMTQNLSGLMYDLAPDDQRFLVAARVTGIEGGEAGAAPLPRFVLVNNFFEILRERVPR